MLSMMISSLALLVTILLVTPPVLSSRTGEDDDDDDDIAASHLHIKEEPKVDATHLTQVGINPGAFALLDTTRTRSKEIAAKTADKATTQTELDEAQKLRNEENAEWKTSDAQDKEAAETVEGAKTVLTKFYKDNNLAFMQKSAAPAVESGEAPPPPPDTWEEDYGGKTGESQGIVSIMEMVHEDIIKDQQKAKADEDDAQGRFDKFKAGSTGEMKALTKQIDALKGLQGKKEIDHGNTKDQRRTKKGELNAVLTKMADIAPNCEYFAVNYKLRASNRAIELDGLIKAKAILQGGTFATPADPNRAMKPGDAFLQRRF